MQLIGKRKPFILIVAQTKKENHMLTILGVIMNLCILMYLGYQESSCINPVLTGLNATQNPWFLSFVGVVALFFALKNQ